MRAVRRYARAFGDFWLDFLVGDTPEIFAGVVLVVGGAIVLHRDRLAGLIYIVGASAAVFVISTARGRRRRS